MGNYGRAAHFFFDDYGRKKKTWALYERLALFFCPRKKIAMDVKSGNMGAIKYVVRGWDKNDQFPVFTRKSSRNK